MRHTVEIADTQGTTMQIALDVDNVDWGGSWRSIDKGYIRYNSGSIVQYKPEGVFTGVGVQLIHDGTGGITLDQFISWGTVNDQGSGRLEQPWCAALQPGRIDWAIV